MEEAEGLRIKFTKLMEDFCVPLDTTMVDNFNELDFHDQYAVEAFVDQLVMKEKILEDKLTLLHAAADLASYLKWIAKLDDPTELEAPFQYLHVESDLPFKKIEAHYKAITEQMRQTIANREVYGLERDLALCEKAFQRVKQIRGVT